MSTPAQVGKNDYREQIARMRGAAQMMRRLLEEMIANTQSGFMQGLLGRIALELMKFDECITRLDEIGREAR